MIDVPIIAVLPPAVTAICFAQAVSTPDPLTGGAGWIGAGLLGAVLSWLLFIHLPAKDKQVKEMVEMQTIEREKDRESREKLVVALKASLDAVAEKYEKTSAAEREHFYSRNDAVKMAIETQTSKLLTAFGLGGCKYPPHHQQPHRSFGETPNDGG